MAKTDDIDLMMLADGELDEDQARELAKLVAEDELAQSKLESLEQVGDSVRTYLELAADDAADAGQFDAMWQRIERRIHADGAPADARAAATIRKKPGVAGESAAESVGVLASIRGWLSEFKGHITTGLVTAGAVAGLILIVRPYERVVQVPVDRPVQVARDTARPTPEPSPGLSTVALESEPPEIENLEVYDGAGMILTIPGEGEEGGAAVIWISNEQDAMEGPI